MKQIQLTRFIFSLILCCLTSAIQQPTIQFTGTPPSDRHPLCDLGCKCPLKGQHFILLDCSRRAITKLPTSLQFDLPLTSITFQNNHIVSLRMSTFSKVDNIEELDFSENKISKIENFTLSPFKSLALLRISHNRLPEIVPGLLDGLNNLRVLELGHNTIQRISSAAFRATPHLQELRLQYNPIFELPEHLFHYLTRLEKLDLQETGLVRLPAEVFKPTPRLQWLSLSNNAFESVPEESLSEAIMLESLDLSGNDFSLLVKGNFRRLSKISLLYLNNLPRLTRIEKDALAGLQKLKSFSCSFNPRLTYVDPEAFGSKNSSISKQSTPPREQLFLRQNALRTLKSPIEADKWSTLSYVDLADNPWKCDCNILWMKELMRETQMNIVCESPPHLRGRALSDARSSELKCEFNWAVANFILVISCIVVFCIILLAVSVSVCSRTPVGLYIRAKKQFSYAKVTPKTETVDLEWDPSADL